MNDGISNSSSSNTKSSSPGAAAFETDAFGAGALAMGTRDRYDHWGFSLGILTALAWPADGNWSLLVSVLPSVVITSGGSSFYLPVGLSGELRW